ESIEIASKIIESAHQQSHPLQRVEERLYALSIQANHVEIDKLLRQVRATLRRPPTPHWAKVLRTWVEKSLPRQLPSVAKLSPLYRTLQHELQRPQVAQLSRFITVRHDGVRLIFNGPKYYGTVRLSVPGDGPWTIDVRPARDRRDTITRITHPVTILA